MNATRNTPAADKKNIFISYREKDTAGETGRLVDALKEHFDDSQIFMDIEKIEPGADFTEVIAHSLESCTVMLAVIGPNWLGFDATKNTLRINDPNDWVRLELATALKRNIRVIPILVDDGMLPTAEQLPPDLEPLLRRQAYEISNNRWKYDADQLIRFLKENVGVKTKEELVARQTPQKKGYLRYWAVGLLVLGIVVFAAVQLLKNKGDTGTQTSGKVPATETQNNGNVGFDKTEPTTLGDTTTSNPIPEQTGTEAQGSRTNAFKDISGRWEEVDEGAKSTFVIK